MLALAQVCATGGSNARRLTCLTPKLALTVLVHACGVHADLQQPVLCPKNLTSEGCLQGLTRVSISTPLDGGMQDVCMAMPKVSQADLEPAACLQ